MIRITGGEARGRRLKVVDTGRVRPTTDKVRQALFNILHHRFDEAPVDLEVLDLFAGSGALGLEALSRGARRATFVEGDRRVSAQLKEGAEIVAGKGWRAQAEIVTSRVDRWLAQPPDRAFDLVFMDPPYADGLVAPTLAALTPWLAPGAVICVEHPPGAAFTVEKPLREDFKRRYGDCEITILTVEETPMRRAIYPGSFDPITEGHVDIIRRGLQVVDEIVVTVACNIRKTPMFSDAERIAMIEEVFADEPRVTVDGFEGLLVDYAKAHDVRVVLRGLRAVSDFEYEFQMASMNRRLSDEVDFIFMMTGEDHYYLSSSLIREVALNGGEITGMVPPSVEARLKAAVAARQGS